MKDLSRVKKVDSPKSSVKSIPTDPALVRRTMGGKVKVIKARGAGAATKDVEHYKSLQGELTVINLVEETIREFYKEI